MMLRKLRRKQAELARHFAMVVPFRGETNGQLLIKRRYGTCEVLVRQMSGTTYRELGLRCRSGEHLISPSANTDRAATVQAAIVKFLPTSEAVAVKEDDLFAMIEAPSRSTARNTLTALLKAGKIGRVGQGVSDDPFRYFKRDT